jgi:hypothetical protein
MAQQVDARALGAPAASSNGASTDAPAARASRRGARRGSDTSRYTLDMPKSLHRWLRMFAVGNDVDASQVLRGLITLLRDDPTLQERIMFAIDAEAGLGEVPEHP